MRSKNCWNKDKTLFVVKGFLAEVVKNQKSVTFYKMHPAQFAINIKILITIRSLIDYNHINEMFLQISEDQSS